MSVFDNLKPEMMELRTGLGKGLKKYKNKNTLTRRQWGFRRVGNKPSFTKSAANGADSLQRSTFDIAF